MRPESSHFLAAAGRHDQGNCDRGQRQRPWPGDPKREGCLGKVCTSDQFARTGRVHQRRPSGVECAFLPALVAIAQRLVDLMPGS